MAGLLVFPFHPNTEPIHSTQDDDPREDKDWIQYPSPCRTYPLPRKEEAYWGTNSWFCPYKRPVSRQRRGGEKEERPRKREQNTGEQKTKKKPKKRRTHNKKKKKHKSKGKKNILQTRPSLSSSSPPSPSSSPGKAFLFPFFLHLLLQKKKTGRR